MDKKSLLGKTRLMLGMASDKQYQILDAMGISLWENHLTSPWVSFKPLLYARCLVLLSRPTQQQKILGGMLSVLNIKKHEIAMAWPSPSNDYQEGSKQTQALLETLTVWAPYSILIMGKSLASQLLTHINIFVQSTYHPEELAAAPEHKIEAYQDLLKLKKYLSM